MYISGRLCENQFLKEQQGNKEKVKNITKKFRSAQVQRKKKRVKKKAGLPTLISDAIKAAERLNKFNPLHNYPASRCSFSLLSFSLLLDFIKDFFFSFFHRARNFLLMIFCY